MRIASLLFSILLGLAGVASAEGPVDISNLTTKLDVGPLLRRLATDETSVRVELPPDLSGKSDIIDLQAVGEKPPYKWAIIALGNPSARQQRLVLAIDRQKFVGSRLFYPRQAGSIAQNIVVSGSATFTDVSVLGEDAYEITLPAQSTQSIAIQLGGDIPDATLWERKAFDAHVRNLTFLQGAIIGISLLSLLSLLLLGAARRPQAFLSYALFAMASLAFMAAEMGYLSQPLELSVGVHLSPQDARAIIETMMAVGLLLYLSSLANLSDTSPQLRNIFGVAAGLGLAWAVYGFVEPSLVSLIARLAFGLIVTGGFFIIVRFADEESSRSALLVWIAVIIWTLLAAMAMFARGGTQLLSATLHFGLMSVLMVMAYWFFRNPAVRGLLLTTPTSDSARRELALAGSQQFVWDYDVLERDVYVGEELEQALGQPLGTLGVSCVEAFFDLMHPADSDAYAAALADAERQNACSFEQELRLRRADGSYRWFELRARALISADDHVFRLIGTLADITQFKRTEERLLRDAVYDQVTGLPNRALFMDRLKRELAKPKSVNLYVILIDVDRFKSVNDGLGHEAGDTLLTALGRRIEALLGPDDTVARFPGDKFAVLFNETAASGDVSIFADRIHEAVAHPVKVNNHEIFLTACLGAASHREDALTPEQLMKDTAIALYEAKRRGTEMFAIFQPSMRDDRGELVALEAELRRALERNEIEVHYQPIARVVDMELAGFEALVRWRHPALGLLAPESFLGLAEQTGMIKDIGRFVLNEATHQLGIWQRAFRPNAPIFMAVNVSASQLVETDLVLDVRAAISREAVYKHTLKLEITESVIMQFPEKAAGILDQIKQLGVGLACDDFGTGYSSLSSLRDLPFDTLKVDRSFVIQEPEDERAAVILDTIVALGHGLGLTIVAEGVENQRQLDRLGALQCDYVQGFFIGHPLTAKQVTDALGAMPYVKAYGKTALSTLWEKTGVVDAPPATAREFTTIDIAAAREAKNRAATPQEEASQPLGRSPMAPRQAKLPPLEQLPVLPVPEKPSAKKVAKPKKKLVKKPAAKKRPPKPSGVPDVS